MRDGRTSAYVVLRRFTRTPPSTHRASPRSQHRHSEAGSRTRWPGVPITGQDDNQLTTRYPVREEAASVTVLSAPVELVASDSGLAGDGV